MRAQLPTLFPRPDLEPRTDPSFLIISSSKGLSGGAIAGIVVGVVCAALLVALALFFLMRRRRTRGPRGGATPAQPDFGGGDKEGVPAGQFVVEPFVHDGAPVPFPSGSSDYVTATERTPLSPAAHAEVLNRAPHASVSMLSSTASDTKCVFRFVLLTK